jgi:hypothetical protein
LRRRKTFPYQESKSDSSVIQPAAYPLGRPEKCGRPGETNKLTAEVTYTFFGQRHVGETLWGILFKFGKIFGDTLSHVET